MGRAVPLLLIGAGAFWAHQTGRLSPLVDWAQDLMAGGQGAQVGAGATPSAPTTGHGSTPQNLGGSGQSTDWGFGGGGLTKEESLVAAHSDQLQPWARNNRTWLAAMMWQESRGNPNAISSAGARGLLQVMPGTFQHVVAMGYNRHGNDPDSLFEPAVSIYIGSAYLEWLSTKSADREWITRAYNAGPGGQRDNGTWPAETVDYLAKIKARFAVLTQNKGVA